MRLLQFLDYNYLFLKSKTNSLEKPKRRNTELFRNPHKVSVYKFSTTSIFILSLCYHAEMRVCNIEI